MLILRSLVNKKCKKQSSRFYKLVYKLTPRLLRRSCYGLRITAVQDNLLLRNVIFETSILIPLYKSVTV